MSLLSVLAKGGWLMIFIGIFSLIALGIFIERMMVLRKARINLNAFLIKIRQYINKGDYENALLVCSDTPGPTAKVLEKGIRFFHLPLQFHPFRHISGGLEYLDHLTLFVVNGRDGNHINMALAFFIRVFFIGANKPFLFDVIQMIFYITHLAQRIARFL